MNSLHATILIVAFKKSLPEIMERKNEIRFSISDQ